MGALIGNSRPRLLDAIEADGITSIVTAFEHASSLTNTKQHSPVAADEPVKITVGHLQARDCAL